MNDDQLRISTFMSHSVAHGPGIRFVLWVQGCSLGCPGCFSPHTHSATGGRVIKVEWLVNRIRSTKGIQGITISGGEPFEQAKPLAGLTDRLRGSGLTVMCYSGFRLVELHNKRCPDMNRLLSNTDILIDGRYRRAEATVARWRGSRNQKVNWLTANGDQDRLGDDSQTNVELLIDGATLKTTGIWPENFIENLHQVLNGRNDDPPKV